MPIFAATTLAAGFAASMALGGNTTLQMPNANTSPAVLYPGTRVEIALNYQSPLDSWIEELVLLESNGRSNLNILDHNGEYSFGCLQFQRATFREYGMKYEFLGNDSDIDNLIYDCELQKEIARRMIEERFGNWRHWYTSVKIKKLGLPPKTEIEEIQLVEAKTN